MPSQKTQTSIVHAFQQTKYYFHYNAFKAKVLSCGLRKESPEDFLGTPSRQREAKSLIYKVMDLKITGF